MEKNNQDQSVISDALRNVPEGEENVITIIRDVGKSGKTSTVTLQRKQIEPLAPVRSESPRRAHLFHSAEGMGEYLKKFGTKNTVVLGDVNEGVIYAVLDEKAEKGFEVIQFRPVVHPLWKPWEELVTERKIELDDFVDFLMFNRKAITEPAGMELIHIMSQVKASTSIEMHRGRGNESLNGILVKTQIQSEEKEDVVDLPTIIELSIPIYVGTEERFVGLDITLQTRSAEPNKIWVFVTTGDLVQAKVDCFMQMFDQVKAADTNGYWIVSLGFTGHQAWDYVKTPQANKN